MFLLDCGPTMYIYVGSNVAPDILNQVLGKLSKNGLNSLSLRDNSYYCLYVAE